MRAKSFNPSKLGPRIKIKDLPLDKKISKEEMKAITGGLIFDVSRLSRGGSPRFISSTAPMSSLGTPTSSALGHYYATHD